MWVSSSGRHTFDASVPSSDKTDVGDIMDANTNELRKRVFCDALAWTEEEGGSVIIGGKDNRVVSPSRFLPPRSPTFFFSPSLSRLIDANANSATLRTQHTHYST